MRVLVADRNALLLECISRTFASRFRIQTATTHRRCQALLLKGRFDLAIISEKLADGPGLVLLGQIAPKFPNMRRVFWARRSRLQLLEGKLRPFRLFRTLAYPAGARELLSMLILVRASLSRDVASVRHVDPPIRTPAAMPFRGRSTTKPTGRVSQVGSRSPKREHAHNASTRARGVRRAIMAAGLILAMMLALGTLHVNDEDASTYISHVKMEQPNVSVPLVRSLNVGSIPRPAPSLVERFEPRPAVIRAQIEPVGSPTGASASLIAEPSTFGSEAYEPVYPD